MVNSVVHFQIFILFKRLVTNLQPGQTNGFSAVWIRRCIFNCVRSFERFVAIDRDSPDRRTAFHQCEFKDIISIRYFELLASDMHPCVFRDILSIRYFELVTIWTGKWVLTSENSEISYQLNSLLWISCHIWTGKRVLTVSGSHGLTSVRDILSIRYFGHWTCHNLGRQMGSHQCEFKNLG